MKKLIAKRYLIKENLLTIIGFCLFVYFSYHSIFGIRSYFTYASLSQEKEVLSYQLAELETERMKVEDKVLRMRPSSLDPDFLEERARVLLGYGFKEDRMIIQVN